LAQIIKITGTIGGLDYESGNDANGTPLGVREAIRVAILDSVDSNKYALWIHTVRKRRRIHYTAEFKEQFATWANEQWHKKKHWRYQYYNEIYITLMHEGQSARLFDQHAIRHSYPIKRNRHYRNDYLERTAADLNRVTS